MPDNSFDIVSKIELPEVSNAVQQAVKEIQQRYDLKTSNSNIELQEKENKIMLPSSDEFNLKAVTRDPGAKLVKRSVPLKGLVHGTITPAAGSTVRQEITLQQGIPIEKARDIVKMIKDSKKKVQASIQGDLVRMSGKDRDTLQEVMALLRSSDFGIDMQFTNYRTQLSPCPEKLSRCFWTVRPDAWRRCSRSRMTAHPGKSPWCAIRIPSTAGPCTTKWSSVSRAGCRSAGAVVLRFNYRGVNLSEGEYAHGEGELEDARARWSYLRGRYPVCRSPSRDFRSDRELFCV